MQKNLLEKEENSSLIKRLSNVLQKNKKSLIRTMAGLGAAAMIATATGCDVLPFQTETETDIETMIPETEKNVISPYDEYKDVEGYISDIAKDIINDPTYEKEKKEFKEYYDYALKNGSFAPDCFGRSDNATCYSYFNNLYPKATNEEILNNTRVFYEFYGSEANSLYVIFISPLELRDDFTVGSDWKFSLDNIMVYSLLEFSGLTKEEQRDLIKSRKDEDIYTHCKMLGKVFNSKEYRVLAENILNRNSITNTQVIAGKEGNPKYSITKLNEKSGNKVNYCIIKDQDSDSYKMYYTEGVFGHNDKEIYEKAPKFANVGMVNFNTNDEIIRTLKYDNIYYVHNINDVLTSAYDYINKKTP